MWCQLFSEPGNGSDLAGLTTRAERDGDEWVINGQKVWNTSAHHAEFGMLLARTDWDVPKHKGITLLRAADAPTRRRGASAAADEPSRVVQRGVPHRRRVPVDMMVGEPGEGWRAALTTLAHERRFAGMFRRTGCRGSTGGRSREAQAQADEYFATYSWYPQRAGPRRPPRRCRTRPGRARRSARAPGDRGRDLARSCEPVDRPACQAARALGRPPGAEGSLGKLAASNVARGAALAHALIGGASAMLDYEDGAMGGVVAEVLVSVPAVSIAGGTDQIQRNIIGEQVLGLPREPSVDRDMPFRDVPRNTGR